MLQSRRWRCGCSNDLWAAGSPTVQAGGRVHGRSGYRSSNHVVDHRKSAEIRDPCRKRVEQACLTKHKESWMTPTCTSRRPSCQRPTTMSTNGRHNWQVPTKRPGADQMAKLDQVFLRRRAAEPSGRGVRQECCPRKRWKMPTSCWDYCTSNFNLKIEKASGW